MLRIIDEKNNLVGIIDVGTGTSNKNGKTYEYSYLDTKFKVAGVDYPLKRMFLDRKDLIILKDILK